MYSSCFYLCKIIECSEGTLKMKSCVSSVIIIKAMEVTGSRKLSRWPLTVLHAAGGEEGKGTLSTETVGKPVLDTTVRQVGLWGCGQQEG